MDEQILRELRGEVPPQQHPEFVRTAGGWLHEDTDRRFREMAECVRDPECSGLPRGTRLKACSRFRSFAHQRRRWQEELKDRRRYQPDIRRRIERVIKYLAIPGSSRHHWGTDVDVAYDHSCRLSNRHFRSEAENRAYCEEFLTNCFAEADRRARKWCDARRARGRRTSARRCRARKDAGRERCLARHTACYRREGKSVALYRWLRENAHSYGFCQPYSGPPEERNPGRYVTGYKDERWHWSDCCTAQPKLEEFRQRMDRIRPTFEDVFGRPRRDRPSDDDLEAYYREVIVPTFEEHVLNVDPSCAKCALSCPEPVEPAAQ